SRRLASASLDRQDFFYLQIISLPASLLSFHTNADPLLLNATITCLFPPSILLFLFDSGSFP
ncbi:hypothetical protein GALMADRAFT_253951, partial [Galerina marginata CBS 339.88]